MADIFIACLPVTKLDENLELTHVKEAVEEDVESIDDDLSLDEATSRFINNELKWRNAANEKAKNSIIYRIRLYRKNELKTAVLKFLEKTRLALKTTVNYVLKQLKAVGCRKLVFKVIFGLLALFGFLYTPELTFDVNISLPRFTLPSMPDFTPPNLIAHEFTAKNEKPNDLEELKRYTQYLEDRLEKLTNFTIERQENLLRSIEALKSRDCSHAIKPDKTGLADYALESSGGEIVPEWTSRGLMTSYPLLKIWEIPLFYKTLSPRLAIQPQVNPGNCFGYNGMEGSIGIKLSRDIVVSAISIEHIPKVMP